MEPLKKFAAFQVNEAARVEIFTLETLFFKCFNKYAATGKDCQTKLAFLELIGQYGGTKGFTLESGPDVDHSNAGTINFSFSLIVEADEPSYVGKSNLTLRNNGSAEQFTALGQYISSRDVLTPEQTALIKMLYQAI